MLEKKCVNKRIMVAKQRRCSVMIPQPVCFCLRDIVKLGQVPFSTLNIVAPVPCTGWSTNIYNRL